MVIFVHPELLAELFIHQWKHDPANYVILLCGLHNINEFSIFITQNLLGLSDFPSSAIILLNPSIPVWIEFL